MTARTKAGAGLEGRRIERLVAEHVAARPDSLAVLDRDGSSLSYAELWEQSGAVAGALAALGVAPGDVVVIALDRSAEMVAAMLGTARAGAAYALLDPLSPPSRNALIINETEARALVVGRPPAPWAPLTDLPALALPLDSPNAPPPSQSDDAGAPFYIAYTSGSTGRPKGAIAPHRAVAHFVADTRLCTLRPSDRVASMSSPASDATTFDIWKPLCAGAAVVVLPAVTDVHVDEWIATLHARGITAMFIMAGLLDLVSQHDPKAFAPLDVVVFGGEALNPDAARRVCAQGPPRRLVLGYGPTETTVFATSFDCTAASLEGRDRIPLGLPLDGYRLSIRDDQLDPVPDGETGELLIGGPAVADGYLARPELTGERFIELHDEGGLSAARDAPTPHYRSGDLVRRLPDGLIEFVGRIDRQVKLRGFRIELEEVERGILATGLVRAAIVEKVDGRGPAHLVCFYVPLDSLPPDSIALRAGTATRLPGYMIPAKWVAVEEFPVTTIGKVDRSRLLAQAGAEPPGGHR